MKTCSKIDWTYSVEYDENRSHCRCSDDYCRCTTVSPVIIDIHYDSILKDLSKGLKLSDIKLYCLDRVIKSLIKIDSFSAYGVGGYYGEEVGVSLDNENEIYEAADMIKEKTEKECIEYALILEYGYLLDEVKDKKWEIKKVNIKQVHPPNSYSKLNKETVDSYSGDEVVLCISEGADNYRIIDGRHRYAAAIKNNKKKISVLTTV